MKFLKIFSKIDTSNQFESWFEEQKDSDNFEEHIGFLDRVESDLLEDSKDSYCFEKGIQLSRFEENSDFKKYFEEVKEKKIKEIAEDWYEDRLFDLTDEMERYAEIRSNGVVCRRAIMVDDVDEFLVHLMFGENVGDFKGLGICYSWNKGKAEAHWGEGRIKVEVDVIIPWNSIDQKATFLLNMDNSLGEEEAEIRAIKGSEIIVISVDGEEFPEAIKCLA